MPKRMTAEDQARDIRKVTGVGDILAITEIIKADRKATLEAAVKRIMLLDHQFTSMNAMVPIQDAIAAILRDEED